MGDTAKCIRCNPPPPGDSPLTGKAHFICDACMDALRHPPKPAGPVEAPVAGTRPAKQKRGRKSARKSTASAVAVGLLLILLAGCTFHRTTAVEWGSFHRTSNLDVDFHPTLLPNFQPQKPAVEISTAEDRPTES